MEYFYKGKLTALNQDYGMDTVDHRFHFSFKVSVKMDDLYDDALSSIFLIYPVQVARQAISSYCTLQTDLFLHATRRFGQFLRPKPFNLHLVLGSMK
jgi:hypothetical protein